MIAVIQRVLRATVYADGELSGHIGQGLYVLLGIEDKDTEHDAELLAEKLHKLRIFCDENGKMNRSADDLHAEILIVSNFTLCANYAHGNRPDYMSAAKPDRAKELYSCFLSLCRRHFSTVAHGRFGADMRTDMITDGPVTIVMESKILDKKTRQKNKDKE